MSNGPKDRTLIDHFNAMERWKARTFEALSSTTTFKGDGIYINSSDVFDFASAFFIWAHSMRDWVLRSSAITQNDLDTELSAHSEWSLVRDLANKVKHKEITRNPRDPHWFVGVKLDPNELFQGKQATEPYIIFSGDYIPIKDTLNSIMNMWNQVFTKLEVNLSESALVGNESDVTP